MKHRTSIAFLACSLLVACAAGCSAAELAGVKLGANIASLLAIGKPIDIGDKQATAPWQRHDIELPDGRFVGVYARDDIIMHIELAARPQTNSSTGIRDFVLNKTKLSHVYKVLGSKGFIHDALPYIEAPDALILNVSYRLKDEPNAMLSFVAVAPVSQAKLAPQSEKAADAAILASVALSDKSYLDSTLGEAKTFSEGEKPVEMK